MIFLPSSVLALATATAASAKSLNGLLGRTSGDACCQSLESSMPGITTFSGESRYQEAQTSYFQGAQNDLHPACRVFPTNASQVSTIMTLATKNECSFAVASGGHFSWSGSNIGPEGFTIDMKSMNTLEMAEDNSFVKVGPGNRWDAVYNFTEARGYIVVGGRASHVGVGGFLSNGGVSFLSFEHGWGASNIVTYELVLANGTILEVSADSHGDLHKALRFGSTNYGIITRLDLTAIPTSGIWGGARIHPESDFPDLLNALEALTPKINTQKSAFNAVEMIRSGADQPYIAWIPIVSTNGTQEWPGILKDLEPVGHPESSTLRVTNYVNLTTEIFGNTLMGVRNLWWSMNIKTDAQLVLDMFEKGKETMDPFFDSIPGLEWNLLAQPMTVSFIQASKDRGGDYSGLDVADGDEWLILGAARWNNTSDDDTVNKAFNQYRDWSIQTAQDRNKHINFIYPNYASNLQDVLGSFGADNVAAMKEVQKVYDPNLLLPKYWKGGYRLQ